MTSPATRSFSDDANTKRGRRAHVSAMRHDKRWQKRTARSSSWRSRPIVSGLQTAVGLVSLFVIGLIPLAMAIDFGGVLWWSQYWMAACICGVTLASVFAAVLGPAPSLLYGLWPIVPATLLVCYSLLQTIPLPSGIARLLSPGSHAAYHEWIEPFLAAAKYPTPTRTPVSVNVEQTFHLAWMGAAAVALFWCSYQAITTRRRITCFLTMLSVSGMIVTSIGVFKMLVPDWTLLGYSGNQQTFANFVNRNNAALFLNYTAAASLGLLAWRLATVSGHELDDDDFELNDLISLIGESESIIAASGLIFSMAGILICGSRGGLIAMLAGCLLGFGWVHRRRGRAQILVVGMAIAACLAILLIPLRFNLRSVTRLQEAVDRDNSTLTLDGRWTHWQDGIAAARGYFPLGSGLGTYGEAHLPFVEKGGRAWYYHADNLWLEWLVELGLPGLILVASLFVIIVRLLMHLTHSSDPLDHGIRVAGWYLVASTIVSQFFDFGLLMPANFAIAVPMIAIVGFRAANLTKMDLTNNASVRRTSADSQNAIPAARHNLFAKKRRRLISIVSCVIVAGMSIVSAFQLLSHAHVETVARQADISRLANQSNRKTLEQIQTSLTNNPKASPKLLGALSSVRFALGRTADAIAAEPRTIEEGVSLYQQTRPLERRLWHPDGSVNASIPISDEGRVHYEGSMNAIGTWLTTAPLSIPARHYVLYLDVYHRSASASLHAMEQLASFDRGQDVALLRVARFAAQSGLFDLASSMLMKVLDVAPHRIYNVLRIIDNQQKLSIDQVLPDRPELTLTITPWLIRRFETSAPNVVEKNRESLENAIQRLDQWQTGGLSQRVQKHRSLGDIQFSLGLDQEAFEHYETAVSIDTNNTELLRHVISRMRRRGNLLDAILLANQMKRLNPDDASVDALVAQLQQDRARLPSTTKSVQSQPSSPK